jgi:TRAP-type C4-dicarboxylate transport system substrate-binding protein
VTVLILTVAAAIYASPATGAERWTFTSHAVAGSVDDRSWQQLLARIDAEAAGRIEVKALLRGEGGPETTYLSHLRRGRVHMSTASFASSTAIVPEVALLSLPYLFESREEVDFVVDRHLDNEYSRLFADKGLVLLRWLDVGWINLALLEPLRTPEAVTGLRLRAPPSPAARLFLERTGADIAVLPFSDVVPGLDTGLIDGAVTTAIMFDGLLRDAAHYYVMTRHSYEVGFLLANRQWFERLSQSDQTLILTGYPDTGEFRANTRTALSQTMRQLAVDGIAVELAENERAAWIERTRGDNRRFVETLGSDAKRIYELILAGKAEFARGAN